MVKIKGSLGFSVKWLKFQLGWFRVSTNMTKVDAVDFQFWLFPGSVPSGRRKLVRHGKTVHHLLNHACVSKNLKFFQREFSVFNVILGVYCMISLQRAWNRQPYWVSMGIHSFAHAPCMVQYCIISVNYDIYIYTMLYIDCQMLLWYIVIYQWDHCTLLWYVIVYYCDRSL